MLDKGNDRNQSEDKGRTSERGFASMPKDEVQEIARKGGEASHGGGRHKESESTSDKRGPKT